MKLSRLRIEQLRKFRKPAQIGDLADGINLFVGPNEAGKSTIAEAIRAAFFERHRSSSVEHLRPWGDGAASPSIEIDFTVGGRSARLHKSFLQRKRCELEINGQRLEGAQAEDHLADLLGFGFAGRGASGPEHWGIPGLLWIEQGAAQDIDAPVAHAADHLQRALGAALGEMASSSGDVVLDRVERARNELLTPATGQPRGDYAEARRREVTLATELAELEGQVATYRGKVDQLATLRRDHAADDTEQPWQALRAKERAAQVELDAVEAVKKSLADVREKAEQTIQRQALLISNLDTFDQQESDLSARDAEREEAQARVQAAEAAHASCKARHEQAQITLGTARKVASLARQEENRRSQSTRANELRTQIAGIETKLTDAEIEQQALLALRRAAAATELSPDDLTALRKLATQLRELEIRRAAAASRLRYDLELGREVRVGNEVWSGDGEALITEPTTLVLPGLGSLEIIPGGSDLAEVARELRSVAERQAAALERLGLPSLEVAEARRETHREHEADIKTREAKLKILAPAGIDALRGELAALRARLEECEKRLAELPVRPGDADSLPSVADAEATEEKARRDLERLDGELNQAGLTMANAQSMLEAAQREVSAAQAKLVAPGRAERLSKARADLLEAKAASAGYANEIETLDAKVRAARPDVLLQDIQRWRASAEALERAYDERRGRIERLEAELQALGAQGIEEKRADVARELEQTRRRVVEMHRRANALDHLLELLRRKRAAVTQRLHAPLQRHLNHYVQLLFPQATLELGEDFVPRLLNRPGTEAGEFHDMSFGAREQMGVISRLAYADLLKEAGRPTLIMLDDALVHSDDGRLAQMKRVLFDAATRHQILLFSCHPEKWRDLGVGARSVEELRGG
ncbi:AAA family ATPase [Burkholderia pseudomallei]|uniref:AAA family ATPase n=1 Tax=Burkholderia pseudomallei TaxID=28450 RepID=UPI0003D95A6C|nr:AAA family ATPase [Burkholderia pseudomallei]AHE26469.1 AAA domain protein [Burkholderia pseudomallei NCTC 13178]ALJ71634.1 Chromosome partition protein Smc [Burkholderia pseudomallei]KGC51249.1 AAA domain protein [Burkholderia pseudomallei]KGD52937.1 AAA domain protein [Burkholderia pseudomallei]